MSEKKIYCSIQGLRTVAFLFIFIEHCDINSTGCLGVSIFIVMSGFLTGILDKNLITQTFEAKINNIFRRVKRLYPLHILTMALAFCVYFLFLKVSKISNSFKFFLQILFNVGLLQSLIPRSDFYFSFNAVSWYLSTYAIIIFLFQFIEPKLIKLEKRQLISVSLLAFGIELVVSFSLLIFESRGGIIPTNISDDIVKWITYISPFYRLLDYIIGFNCGRLFKLSNLPIAIINIKIISLLQVIAIIAIPMLQLIYYKGINNPILNSFRYSLLYLPVSIVLVATSMFDKGFVSRVLSCKAMVKIGNLSAYAFLIHQLVIVVFKHFGELYEVPDIITYAAALVCTIAFSYTYYKILNINTKLNEYSFNK